MLSDALYYFRLANINKNQSLCEFSVALLKILGEVF